MKIWLKNLLSEAKQAPSHIVDIHTEYVKEIKSHDWFHAFADEPKMIKGRAHMDEIRGYIAWINNNGDSDDRNDFKKIWEKYAPAQFKKLYPKNLKKGSIPGKVKAILRTKPRKDITGIPGN
tara:strand:+ start:5409 stop:5774 length:366 start_codon:yes stop_codon:yes gene_type:complete